MTIGLGQGILVRMTGELGIAKVLAFVQVCFTFPHQNIDLAQFYRSACPQSPGLAE